MLEKKEIKNPILTNEECENLLKIVKSKFTQYELDTEIDKTVYEEIEFFRTHENFEMNDFLFLKTLSFSDNKNINKKILNKYINDNQKININTIEYFKKIIDEIDLIVSKEIKNNLIENINIINKTIKPYYSIFKKYKEAIDKEDYISFYEIHEFKQKYFSKSQIKFETKKVIFDFFNTFCKDILNLNIEFISHNEEDKYFKIKVNEEVIDLLIKTDTASHSGRHTAYADCSEIEIISSLKGSYLDYNDIATLFHEFGHFYEEKILQNKKRFKINTQENYSMFFEFLFLLNDDIHQIFVKGDNIYHKNYRELIFLENLLYQLNSLKFIIEDKFTFDLNQTNYLKFLNNNFYTNSKSFTNYIVAIDNIVNNRIDNLPIKLELPKELLDNKNVGPMGH